jgi:hypothetical protein
MCAVFQEECPSTSHISGAKKNPKCGFKQVMIASELTNPVVTPKHYSSQPYSAPFESEELGLIVVPDRFRHVFYGTDVTEFAGMAANDPVSTEGLLTTDCGATSTLTDSLFNMTNVEQKLITIQLAMDGATMQATHVGTKTYYVYDRTGTLRPVSTRAFYVKELKQDLLGGRALVKSNYRVILDKDPNISGIYPVASDGSIDPANVSHLLVSTQKGFSFFGHQLFPHKNMKKCRDIRCGTEDYRIAPMMPFAKQLIMLLEWMN